MTERTSESTEQLSSRAYNLLNDKFRELLATRTQHVPVDDGSPQGAEALAPRVSVAGARRELRAEWARLKGSAEALAGVVALVCVRRDSKAFALRAALSAMGATVLTSWSPLVTHVVWESGGASSVRVRARNTNAHVVSPRWVAACAARHARVCERDHATPSRASDPPDPAHLTRILKMAAQGNIPLPCVLEDKENVTVTQEKSTQLVPKGAEATSKRPPMRSRRKLFTQLENADSETNSEPENEMRKIKNPYGSASQPVRGKRKKKTKEKEGLISGKAREQEAPTPRQCTFSRTPAPTHGSQPASSEICVVFSGVDRVEREQLGALASGLQWRVQPCVSARTTHVAVGRGGGRTLGALAGAVRGCWVVRAEYVRQCAGRGAALSPREFLLEELAQTSARARLERSALQCHTYTLAVFADVRVCVLPSVRRALALARLLRRCGATLLEHHQQSSADVVVAGEGDAGPGPVPRVRPLWVADSVARGRPLSFRRYLLHTTPPSTLPHTMCTPDT